MWWDVYNDVGYFECEGPSARMNLELIWVMQSTLTLKSEACWEAALHGLGHRQVFYPDEVAAAIDEFLSRNPGLDLKLRDYALKARDGQVR